MEGMLFDTDPSTNSESQASSVDGVGKEDANDGRKHTEEDLRPRDLEALAAYRKTGSASKAAEEIGCASDTMQDRLVRIRNFLGLSDIRELLEGGLANGATHDITPGWLMQLIQEQDYRCALTGRILEPETAALDHKVPIPSGGSHSRDNVWWVHSDVNTAKGTMETEAFISMCREVAEHSAGNTVPPSAGVRYFPTP